MPSAFACAVLLLAFTSRAPAQDPPQTKRESELQKLGHSRHGDAFDEGPRQKPWRMEGIGKSHFPVTTSVPEVQEWFDQGHTLLHSFWYYEAERAFRWCVKLDPECAMAYWGLARAVSDARGDDASERQRAFLKEAVRRKDQVTPRERKYIEAWEAALLPNPLAKHDDQNRRETKAERLESIAIEFPDDLEAKALLALENMGGGGRYANDLLLRAIIERAPEHPGAHHYRIHNWDGPQGQQALDSCAIYGRIAPAIGHANHMPGHIYSGVGMWHEAAIWMDSATRIEQRYMQQCLTLPFNTWNYAHNRNYLAYIQEQLGMAAAALTGARDLLAAPLDLLHNNPDKEVGRSVYREGLFANMRTLIKFGRWSEVLELPWRKTFEHKMWQTYCEALANVGLGKMREATEKLAALKDLGKDVSKPENQGLRDYYEVQWREVQGLLELRSGATLEGIASLTDAAERDFQVRKYDNDPPDYPRVVYDVLGQEYLDVGSPALAAKAYAKSLDVIANDGFALLGLTRAGLAQNDRAKAEEWYARLQHVWSRADAEVRRPLAALGLTAAPKDVSPGVQRPYDPCSLDALGPATWQPYDAPRLDALDSKLARVSLSDYRGKNVLLVFYLGDECPHCIEQLVAIKARAGDFAKRNTELLAISSQTPEANLASTKVADLPMRLLSDTGHENARRFHSYDDFEDLELHSTILIDSAGKVRWARNGGDPFTDLDFLIAEIDRWAKQPTSAP